MSNMLSISRITEEDEMFFVLVAFGAGTNFQSPDEVYFFESIEDAEDYDFETHFQTLRTKELALMEKRRLEKKNEN